MTDATERGPESVEESARERDATPKVLRSYLSLGVRFRSLAGTWVDGDCPFCADDRGKFAVSPLDGGRYKCVHCGAAGNATAQFLQRYWDYCLKATSTAAHAALAAERRLLDPATPRAWGAVRSTLLTDTWLLPGYDPRGKLTQLYRYVRDAAAGRRVLKATAELPHGMFRAVDCDLKKGVVYQAEGPWDGMALWELFRRAKPAAGGAGYERTGNRALSLAADNEVVAVPGVTSFPPGWAAAYAGKAVALMYDSDLPRTVNGKTFRAGYDGMQRVSRILAAATGPPEEVHWLKWGEEGYDPTLAGGHDVRDHLTPADGGGTLPDRLARLGTLLDKVEPIPPEWIAGRPKGTLAGVLTTPPRDCRDYKTLVAAWRRSGLKWTEGLDRALSAILASVFSTPTVGEQLWCIIMAPPSSAKTILCEAISLNRALVFPTDTFTSLVSGYQLDKEGSQNLSLVKKLNNKTLVINDGDTLLRLPNREQVLSQLRAFYGRNLRTQYANLMSADHEGINCTVVMAGTGSLLELDAAEFGARFLICDLGTLDVDLEEEIAWRVANQAEREMGYLSDGKPESRDSPELAAAKALTAGYLDHLRVDPLGLIRGCATGEEALRVCMRLGQFVASMRCRPPKKQEEKVEKEMPFRLIKQYVRLAKCLAVVRNKPAVDAEVLDLTRAVAADTAQGVTLDVAKELYRAGAVGLPEDAVVGHTHLSNEKARKLLHFLRRKAINVVETYTAAAQPGERVGRKRWRLAPRVRELYEFVFPQDGAARTEP